MIVDLFPFQQKALANLRAHCASAHNEYRNSRLNQVVSFTAPTGSGKTIIMSALIEAILFGDEKYMEQPDAIFVWLSDSPQLNEQSRDKIDSKADKIRINQCVTIKEESFDRECLEDGHIYFLNTQKLGKGSRLVQHSDNRKFTIWETLANTVREKSNRLYFIIDEAHRGMKNKEAGKATSIMQKFILGSEVDGLPAIPVVIGMSATIQRFNQLVKNSTSTTRPVKITPDEVRASGLLKDRVIITYPTDASEQKDMAVLQAATDEWMEKCRHWDTYCREQHHWMVNPVFVVQVLNGSGEKISDTNLDDCLEKIEQRSGMTFAKGEVVHAFGETKGCVTINGLEVPYEEPSKITDNKYVKVVFFKETLSTGWDCPRAETMMSFRRYVDATAIAQLLGRMVRTPIQKHILVDDMLNDVRLFLPHFDADKVNAIVEELQNSEGGELPTEIIEDEFERGNYMVVTIHPKVVHPRKKDSETGPVLPGFESFFTQPSSSSNHPSNTPSSHTSPQSGAPVQAPQNQTGESMPSPLNEVPTPEEIESEEAQLEFDYGTIDRPRILEFINDLALQSYQVRSFQMNSYLKSLFRLVTFLITSNLNIKAKKEVEDEIVELIHNYILTLKNSGKYTASKEKILNFEMLSNVYDAFGEEIRREAIRNFFAESDVDLDRQLRLAEKNLGDEGISNAYGRKYIDIDNQIAYKVDVILFAFDEECLKNLHEYAKHKYHELNDAYRQKTTRLSDQLRTRYRDIVRDSAEVSQVPFSLSENMAIINNPDGTEYSDHLFVNEETGVINIKLNTWEVAVIEEEQKSSEFRCWYRNPSRGSGALAIVYDYKGLKKLFYPDFLIVRKECCGDYILDILEPHDPTRDDNVWKAKALARYADENPSIGRAQLIRMSDGVVGKTLRRLDFAASSELREKVKLITLNEELDKLFIQYGK